MQTLAPRWIAVFLSLGLLCGAASAQDDHPAVADFRAGINQIFSLLESEARSDGKSSASLEQLEVVMANVIAFEPLGRSVMGRKIAAKASEESIARFVRVFRRLVVSTYVDILRGARRENLTILPLQEDSIISPQRVRLGSKIRLENGGTVTANYDMRPHEGRWRVFNIQIVLEGGAKINFGRLISRQFSTIFKQAAGDLERTIDLMEASVRSSEGGE